MKELIQQPKELFKMHTPNQRGIQEGRLLEIAYDECATAVRNIIGSCDDMHIAIDLLRQSCMYAHKGAMSRPGNREKGNE